MPDKQENPAEAAGRVTLEKLYACLDEGRSFRLEAGAGAGKTYSLEKALRHLIERRGKEYLRGGQQIGCITFTNVAKDEILSRIQAHPAVWPETIHGFCWSILKDFQSTLRQLVPGLDTWPERLEPVGGVGGRCVQYELGYPFVAEDVLSLRHEDVISLMVQALNYPKFRLIFSKRYPIVLIDEYQDTNVQFVDALKKWFLDEEGQLQLGFFGDHWQKIYGEGCGLIEHAALEVIDKNANFRSKYPIVKVLNGMRPALPQIVPDETLPGEARVFHTNDWEGERRTGQGGGHWTGDTTPEAAKAYFEHVKVRLTNEGWNFDEGQTKILMLSHSVLAREQGYPSIPPIYGQFTDPWLKKEDPHIKFFTDQLEPACAAFEKKRFGEMFECFGSGRPNIRRHSDKIAWSELMNTVVMLRKTKSVGEVTDFIRNQSLIHLPEPMEKAELKLAEADRVRAEEETRRVVQLRELRKVAYSEIIALDDFIDGHTPFSTKHGVKGAEFENVLVIVGRGWNKYNFGQMLEWVKDGPPVNKVEFHQNNRNLFYVACSRPKTRLAVLFTQILSQAAMQQLSAWFGADRLIPLPAQV